MPKEVTGEIVALNKVIWKKGNSKPRGLKWYGEMKTAKKDKPVEDSLYDDKIYLAFEDEDERIGRGSDRYDIKVITVTVNSSSSNSTNRQTTTLPDNQILVESAFDFVYECPLVRDFCKYNDQSHRKVARDFLRITFIGKVPDTVVQKILKDGILCEDPHNENEICLYRFFAYTPSQSRQRSCTMINYDAKFWLSSKLDDVDGYEEIKSDLENADRIENQLSRKELKRQIIRAGVSSVWNYFGNFSKIKVVAKYAARIGLLLSPTRTTIFIPDGLWEIERDILGGPHDNPRKYEFTDGCGRMSTQLARKFCDKLEINYRYRHQKPYQVPSVLQFRMMGCKGILVHDPTLDEPGMPWLVLRDSQRKFEWNMKTKKHLEWDVGPTGVLGPGRLMGTCTNGESRPFSFGKLNKQYVILLDVLKINNATFLEIQKDHFDRLRRCMDDRMAAFEILSCNNKMEEADLLTKLDEESPLPFEVAALLKKFRKPVFEHPLNEHDTKEEKEIANSAFYIPISKSRNIYGVADISGKLHKGECFVQVTEHSEASGQRPSHQRATRYKDLEVVPIEDGARVLVNKCPTYHPGDFRILRQRFIPELAHLVDVVVFPVAGPHNTEQTRPHPHEMHESDLDGDEYFVCWDERMIPEAEGRPLPSPDKTIGANTKEDVTLQDLIREFSETDHMIGRINNLFMKWADLKGANSQECRDLAKMFNQSVDQAKHGGKVDISQHLQSARDRQTTDVRIQGQMIEEIKRQPFQATAEILVRYKGLNNPFRPLPVKPRFFFVDINTSNSKMNFHCMLKYGLWTDPNAVLIERIANAYRRTQRSVTGCNTSYFNDSVFIVAFREVKRHEKHEKVVMGLAQVKSSHLPLDWKTSPFKFAHQSVLITEWVFCKEFDLPQHYIIGEGERYRMSDLKHGDLIPTSIGMYLFNIFRTAKKKKHSRHQPFIMEEYLEEHWAKNEEYLMKSIRATQNKTIRS